MKNKMKNPPEEELIAIHLLRLVSPITRRAVSQIWPFIFTGKYFGIFAFFHSSKIEISSKQLIFQENSFNIQIFYVVLSPVIIGAY